MELKVAQISKIENHYSNISNVYKMFKGNLMLMTEEWKWYGTAKCFHH